ncbi:hypothetical protein [Achromobacter deleyi]|uniref:hypothetical protein n=1 Tax=Achromobacter deleyi TaxID=1353891 RepID=UPI00149115AE|nr:hypothetical protein [Achromobacter deleyi]QVQ24509.1 hypothetical protein HLG70_16550 [Achromobacter deleyi]UIP20042.1 hypothetical protein LYZ39_24160 [Achromobacter deleyi]
MAHVTAVAHRALRRWMAAWLCLGCLLAGSATAQDFNRAAELQRYRTWLKDFTQDMDRLSATRRPISGEQLDAMFERTVVPGSRAAGFIRGTFTQRGSDGAYVPRYGPRPVFMGVLESAIPAGQGGIYPETEAALKGPDLTVWYMHVDVGDMTNAYLLSPENFTPYRLPPSGTLERKAYPFLLMESREGALRLGGVSGELWGLIVYLHNAAN